MTSFRLDGIVDGKRVEAVWDGLHLRVTDVLYDRASLAVAVDSRSTLTGRPTEVALTLARCCDEITGAEYECCGQRRVVA